MNIGDDDLEFLRAVARHGGTATKTEIRAETGFRTGKTDYRFDKLTDLGLIDIDYADESDGSGAAPKVAEMTSEGEQVVRRRGDGPDDDDETLRESVERLHERLDRAEARLDVVTQMHHDLADEQEYLAGQMGLAEVYLRAARRVFENDLNIDFEQVMKEIDEGKD
ncbi:hypothetical protein [Halorussus salinisoli]|uniref:hypothetical protein n=1 Tax=Halorussus salinisoli TaxID=2558242 RepID=UPI0010C21CFE|nr:hypothetical protein [Halorussus salinisoli]